MGYTQEEFLEADFASWIGAAAEVTKRDTRSVAGANEGLLRRLRFDAADAALATLLGYARLGAKALRIRLVRLRPLAVCLLACSGTISMTPRRTGTLKVAWDSLRAARDREQAKPESLLYQAGYLTTAEELTLDYPKSRGN